MTSRTLVVASCFLLTWFFAAPTVFAQNEEPSLLGEIAKRLAGAVQRTQSALERVGSVLEQGAPILGEQSCQSRHGKADVPPDERQARIVLCEASWQILAGRVDEAEATVQAALPEFERRGNSRAQAEGQLLLANLDSRRESYPQAMEHFRLSLDLWAELGDEFGQWVTLWGRGEGRHFLIDLPGASADFQQATRHLDTLRGGSGPLSLRGLRLFAFAMGLGDPELEHATQVLERGDILDVFESMTLASLGDVQISSRLLESAETTLQEAWRLSQTFHILDGNIQRLLGDVDLRRGRYAEARDHDRGARRDPAAQPGFVRGQLRDRLFPWAIPYIARERALSLGRLAAVEGLLGNLDAAEDAIVQAKRLAQGIGARDLLITTTLQQAAIEVMRGAPGRARQRLDEADEIAQVLATPSWSGLILAERGRLEVLLQNWSPALDYLQAAIDLLEPTGQHHALAELKTLQGDVLSALERLDLAEAAFEDAEAAAELSPDARLRAGVWLRWGWLDHRLEEYASAHSRFARALDFARDAGEPGLEAQVLMAIAQAHRSTGESNAARAALDRAFDRAGDLLLPRIEVRLFQARLDLDTGHLDSARRRAAESADLARRGSMRLRESLALAIQGDAARRQGQTDDAIALLRSAAALVDDLQQDLDNDSFLASFSEVGPSAIYGLLVEMLAESSASHEAWEWAQRARARVFQRQLGGRLLSARPETLRLAESRAAALALERRLDAGARSGDGISSRPRALDMDTDRRRLEASRRTRQQDIRRAAATLPRSDAYALQLEFGSPEAVSVALPANAVWLEYFVTRNRIVAWRTDAGRPLGTAITLPRPSELEAWLADLRRAITENELPPSARLEALSRTLLDPVLGDRPPARLVLVPHGPLHDLPFALLPAGIERRPLVATTAISILPASSLALAVSVEVRPAHEILVFGDPRENLSGAVREARAVAQLWNVTPRLGPAATEAEFLRQAGNHRVVHVAAHGRSEIGLHADRSRLELAPGEGQDGQLAVYEVAELDLRATELVILSACNTSQGARTSSDDVTALPQAFLAAGAKSVVSSSWLVDDPSAAALMETLHLELQQGTSADDALRRMQARALEDGLPAHLWATFQLFGRGYPAPRSSRD